MWSDEPTLDPDTTARLAQLGGPGFVGDLLRLFEEHGALRVAAVESAAERMDLVAVRRGAHSLVSTAGNLGARRLAALCTTLERAAATLDAPAVAALVPALAPAFAAARAELARRLPVPAAA